MSSCPWPERLPAQGIRNESRPLSHRNRVILVNSGDFNHEPIGAHKDSSVLWGRKVLWIRSVLQDEDLSQLPCAECCRFAYAVVIAKGQELSA